MFFCWIFKNMLKIFRKFVVVATIFSLIFWGFGNVFQFSPVVRAAVSVLDGPNSILMGSPGGASIGVNSPDVGVISFTLNQDTGETLSSVKLALIDLGGDLSPSDIANVKVFRDEGDGFFGAGDLLCGSSTNISIGTNTPITISTLFNNSIAPGGTGFFITISTGATWSDSAPDEVGFEMPTDAIITSANSPVISEFFSPDTLLADTTGPQVVAVEYVNSNTVDVVFDDVLDSSAENPANYSFNSSLNVTQAMFQGPNTIRLNSDGDVYVGTTTVTVSSSVTDMAGNQNTTLTPQAVQMAVKVKISEISAEYNVSGDEFVEIYNASESAIDISSWQIQYSPAGSLSWTTIATVPSSTTLSGFGFYLFGTSGISPSPDTSFSALMDLSGGHIRLYDGSKEIDKIGWGNATSPEGTAISAHSQGESLERKAFGQSWAEDMAVGGVDEMMGNSWDTNDNSFDFLLQSSPAPQNSSSPTEQPQFDFFGGGGPMIMHMPINFAPTGLDLNVLAQMGDPATPLEELSAKLYYMSGDGTPSDNVPSDYTVLIGNHQGNGVFQFTIPQAVIDGSTANGIYYFLEVQANTGTAYMSADPDADISGDINLVAANPFVVSCGAQGTTYLISGDVQDESSNPLAGVLVALEGTGYSTSTDASGHYVLNAPNGVYNIFLLKDGYYEEFIRDVFVNDADFSAPTKTLFEGTGGGATGDSVNPIVTWSGPPDGMMGIPANDSDFDVFIGFSKDINQATFSSSSVYYTIDGTTPIYPANIEYDNDPSDNEAMMRPIDNYLGVISPPSGGFLPDKTYYLILNGFIRDTSGNALVGNRPEGGHVISFSTGAVFDVNNFGSGAMIPPFVIGTNPVDGALDVSQNTKIAITFSDVMDSDSVTTSGNITLNKITISNGAELETPVNISVSLDTSGKIAIVSPTSVLSTGRYRLTVSGALKSASGIWMGDPGQSQNVSSYPFYGAVFDVGSSLDNQSPSIIGLWPEDGQNDVPVNPGAINIQFSESLNPTTVNSNTVTLKRGSSLVNADVNYDANSNAVYLTPNVVLASGVDYTLTITGSTTGIADLSGNYMASSQSIVFTTSNTGDNTEPELMFANGDDFSVAITFSEPMQAAKIVDTANWGASVLNYQNYVLRYGPPSSVRSSGNVVDLSNAKFSYDAVNNTVIIENLGLDPATLFAGGDVDFYVNMASSTVSGEGASDLSGNKIMASADFQMPINHSADTMGILGPGSFSAPMDMGQMGMMMAGAFPMNSLVGQNTIYFVDIPTSKAIPVGGKIVLTFPTGFDVSGAQEDAFSPMNDDINGYGDGVVGIASIVGNQTNRTVTITINGSATQSSDYLHIDIAGIVNSSIPRGPETSGYSVDLKTLDDSGNLLETIETMPFFISAGGNKTLTVVLDGVTSGDNGDVHIFLDSPMTGPIQKTATFNNSTSENVVFNYLESGQYMLFTEPVATLSGTDYSGQPIPMPIMVSADYSTTTITLNKESAGAGKASITVNVIGSFGTDDIDIFAQMPGDFKVKTIENAGDNPSATFYLPDGDWMIGMGPAMPKNSFVGPPPMPDWMPPMPTELRISGNGTVVEENSGTADDGTIVFTISSADKQIVGYVKDADGSAIADADVWAYQPMGENKGAYTKTDSSGKFVLKVSENGVYSVGANKPGLPSVPEKSVDVQANTAVADGNTTADVYADNALITDSNLLQIILKMPSHTISGKVTNGTDPISGAPVWANRTDGEGHADTMSDSSGNYVLYVDDGVWNVHAYISGYGEAEVQTVVVNGSDETQNLAPDTSVAYYTINGTVTIDSVAQTFMPIRAVEFDDDGNYTGKEFNASTDASGNYSITVPGNAKYRVDIWTDDYGEVALNTDEVPNNPANVVVSNSDVFGKDITIASANLRTVNFYFANAQAGQEGFLNIDGVNYSGGEFVPNGFHRSLRISDLSASTSVSLADGDYLIFLDVPGLGSYIPDDSSNPDGRDAVKDDIVVSADRWVDFTLPSASSDMVTISGTVYGGSVGAGNELADAWVWIDDTVSAYHNGTQSAADGSFSLSVPVGSNYKIGVDKPGYISDEPDDLDASTSTSGMNLLLSPSANTISGHIYYDANSNGVYDSGEEIDGAFVRAVNSDSSIQNHAPADGSGYYEIGVVDGVWRVYAVADGYEETQYPNQITINSSDASADIALTIDPDWDNRTKQKPMTPASGGSMDDTAQDSDGSSAGTGLRLVVPPNALGNSSAAGSLSAKRTSAVVRTGSADPIGGKGVNVSALDNSGQAITNLNDYVDVELVLYKADVEAEISAGNLSYDALKVSVNAYWDSTINDWVRLTTSRKAYYKNAGDTDWTLYSNSNATSSFEAFIDTLPGSYSDYKLVYSSSVNHFTVFGTITASDSTAPSAPSSLSATAGNGSVVLDWADNSESDLMEYQVFRGTNASFTCNDASQINTSQLTSSNYTDSSIPSNQSYTYYYKVSAVDTSGNISDCSTVATANYTYTPSSSSAGASAGVQTTYCTDVSYYDWQETCIDGWQYRNIMIKNPANCVLTSEQEAQRKRECAVNENIDTDGDGYTDAEEIKNGYDPKTPAPKKELKTIKEMKILDKISLILSEAKDVFKANVNAILAKIGIKRDLQKEKNVINKYARHLLNGVNDFSKDNQYALTNFITYGTKTTRFLGEGERAGVLNSYKSAFGKLPKTEEEWQDVVKIANGRWPSKRDMQSEKNAQDAFAKIYKRQANRANIHDDSAVMIIAYGLRPANRNLNSEKFAIKVFKSVYGYAPKSASAWDIVRAIAYSGATR